MTLGRKQSLSDQHVWEQAWESCRLIWTDPDLDRLIDQTVTRIHRDTKGKRVAYGWSGGKDSIALQLVMDAAGIHECMLAISALEHPKFLRWATDWMPDGLTIVERRQIDLAWLRKHPEMLFPQGRHGPLWFKLVQHRGQREYFQAAKLDMIALGRRWADSNYTGPGKGEIVYTNREGVTRYSPIADWPHEAVLAIIKRAGVALPPTYSWPRGFQVGTGSWPARQWTRSLEHGWAETYEIDPTVVHEAAEARIPGARDHLDRMEA